METKTQAVFIFNLLCIFQEVIILFRHCIHRSWYLIFRFTRTDIKVDSMLKNCLKEIKPGLSWISLQQTLCFDVPEPKVQPMTKEMLLSSSGNLTRWQITSTPWVHILQRPLSWFQMIAWVVGEGFTSQSWDNVLTVCCLPSLNFKAPAGPGHPLLC